MSVKIKRKSFTLIELLLVLGIIVAMVGMGLPLVQRMVARNQIKSAARELQSQLHQTRLEAIKSGDVMVFRYRLLTSDYEILPKSAFDQRALGTDGAAVNWDATATGSELLEGKGVSRAAGDSESDSPDAFRRILPSGIIFASTAEHDAAVENNDWSPPILFFPNGRTSHASVTLVSTEGYDYREKLVLRGLTGMAGIVEEDE